MAAPRSTTITHVDNGYMGCFVACVGMLMGLPYSEAFKKVFPERREGPQGPMGGGCSPRLAFRKLERLGFQPRMLPAKTSTKSLKQTSLIWLRWGLGSELMHSLIYEKESNLFLDPNYENPVTDKLRLDNINRFKENIVALDGYVPPVKRIVPEVNYDDYYLY